MKKYFIFSFIFALIIGGSFLLQSFLFTHQDEVALDEYRQLDSFNKIAVSGNFEVHLTSGNQSVQIMADLNVLQEIETKVKNKELKIGWEKNSKNKMKNNGKIIIHISISELEGLSIAGSGIIKGESKFTSPHLSTSIAGSGEISIEINATSITSDIAGSGNIFIQGSSNKSEISIAGSGNYDAGNLETKETEISIAGSGNAEVAVSNILNIDIAGSGEVLYNGNPKVESNIAGNGKIRKLSN